MGCLKDYVAANPRKSIAVFALVAAMVSCYPVFFGMSFVSPVGLYYLYPYPPLVPDFMAEVVCEDFRQSDIGAAGYSIVPNTVVQWNALSWDLEFPFWTRFVGCGTPLFAQGQSMIGDILHWIPVAAGGSAVAWDIKFILSKAVFAAGVGLVAFEFTSSLPAGLLLAISSCFLGFFAFRFNHPAFFVLTYAPWIVLQWARLGDALAVKRPQIISSVAQAALLAAVTWLQLNAGAPKEGVITACFMHFLGIVAFVGSVRNKWGWVRSFAAAIGFSVGAIMVAAPHWLLFLDALAKSYTVYDDPVVDTYPLWSLVGFFDNFFFQQIDGTLLGPSTNIFVLLCMGSSLVGLRRTESIPFRGAWILFAAAFCVAFGLVPYSVLALIPFIKNIHHVGNTFSVPMMVLALILAGFGILEYTTAPQKRKKLIAWSSLSVFFGLLVLYLVVNPESGTFVFFMIVFAVAVLGLWGLHKIAGKDKLPKYALTITICCFVLLHVRHGMHLMTSTVLDQYVTNPRPRADLSKESQAIAYLKQRLAEQGTPARIIGERQVMFPGYNSLLGFESLVSVEPLRNRQYERLLTLVDYPEVGYHWLRLIRSDQIPGRSSALDLLNVRYVLAVPGTPMPQDMRLIHSSDLDVWERPTAWPRAFFVNHVFEARQPTDIPAALYRFPHVPFAVVENRFVPPWLLTETGTGYQVVPARRYSLTNNSTRFFVDATGPGLIVLGETYYPGDFIAKVNGEAVDYIRVNHAFKGVWIKKAGTYEVEFTYRPERLSQAMIVCLCGVAILLGLCAAISLGRSARKPG
ncbi:MAG: Bacterial membrane protein YfhO [Syntrophorhabdus sp. PtaB.Bin006]|nr:MAG: Bacterial membrane protein YfhO [Syntrophorhabdus sp. PtaB.Bin006]